MLAAVGASVAAWAASKGVGLLIGFAANLIASAIRDWQANAAQRQVGALTVARDQAQAGQQAEAALAAEAAKSVSEDDAIARLDGGSA